MKHYSWFEGEKCELFSVRLNEPLIYPEVHWAQGCAANIQSLKRLNIEEKRRY